nr:MAG TPA: hypothetical protein [Caudoviricetes sp.]
MNDRAYFVEYSLIVLISVFVQGAGWITAFAPHTHLEFL